MTVFLCLVFLFFNPSDANLANKTLERKLSSCEANVSCPAIVAPLCVRVMKTNQTDAAKRFIHMVVVNKCEIRYMKCHQGVEAAVVPMKNCDSGHKKLPSKPIGLGKKRVKRRADPKPPKEPSGLKANSLPDINLYWSDPNFKDLRQRKKKPPRPKPPPNPKPTKTTTKKPPKTTTERDKPSIDVDVDVSVDVSMSVDLPMEEEYEYEQLDEVVSNNGDRNKDYVDVKPNLVSFKGRKTKEGKVNSAEAKMRADDTDNDDIVVKKNNKDSSDIEVPNNNKDSSDIEVPNKNKDPSDIVVPNNNKDSSDIEVPNNNKDPSDIEVPSNKNTKTPSYPDNKVTDKPGPNTTPNSDNSYESGIVTPAPDDSDEDDATQTTVSTESTAPDDDSSTTSPNRYTDSDVGSDFDSQMKKFDQDMKKFNEDFHETFPSANTGSGADGGNDDSNVKKLKHVAPGKAGEALQAFEDDMVEFEKDMKLFENQLSVENPRVSYTEEAGGVLKEDVDSSNEDGGEEKEEVEGEESKEEQRSPENADLVMPPPGGGVKSLVDNEYGQAADDEATEQGADAEDKAGQVSSAESEGIAAAKDANSDDSGADDENNGQGMANDENGDDEKTAAENGGDDENNGQGMANDENGDDEKTAAENGGDDESNGQGMANDENGEGETAAEDVNSNENGTINEKVENGLADQYGADGVAADKDDDNLPQLTLGDWQDYTGDCPKECPSRDVMICARCLHDVYRTFLSTCHLRMFACEQPDEKLQLVARTSCAASAPFLADLSDSVKRVSEARDDDAVLRFVYCRMKGLDGGKSPAAFKGTNAKCGIAAQ